MAEQAIFTVLVMVSDGSGNLLMEDRNDPGLAGYLLPRRTRGAGEAFTAAAIRETREETGLTIENPTLCGVKQFPAKGNARYVVFFYKADRYTGDLQSSDEGEVFWLPRQQLSEYHLVEDFMDMLKVFESDTLNEFQYYQEDNGEWGLRLL